MDFTKSSTKSRSRTFWLTALTVPIVVGTAAIASAHVDKTWVSGEVLKAADLNAAFHGLDVRIEALETPPAPNVLEAADDTGQTSDLGQDLVYQSISLELSPGTWRIDGFATLATTYNPDGVQIGLWDDTNDVEIDGARGPYTTNVSYSLNGANAGCDGTNTFCSAVNVTTSKVVTLDATTTVRLAAFRNGLSRVVMVDGASINVKPGHRLLATKLD